MYGARSGTADNDNHKPKLDEHSEIPIPPDERRAPPAVEARAGFAWFCLVTVPQNEYRCADALSDKGATTYVPTNTTWGKRRKGREFYDTELQAPLFRGYVFVQMSRPQQEDRNGETVVTLGNDWNPIFERDAFGQAKLNVLKVLGDKGIPVSMPLRHTNAKGEACGIATLADDERAGWFDERKRPFLVALQEQQKAEAAAAERSAREKAEHDARAAERAAKRAEEEAKRLRKPVWSGDAVRAVAGAFTGFEFVAENDNDDKGLAKVSRMMFGQETIAFIPVSDLENLSRPYATPRATDKIAVRRA